MTTGHCVTLTYTLTADTVAPAERKAARMLDSSTTRCTPLFAAVQLALRSPEFMPVGMHSSSTHETAQHLAP